MSRNILLAVTRNKTNPFSLSRKTISGYLKLFMGERAGVLDFERTKDIEPVHRMRVASRRLRAAIRVFEPLLPADKYAVWSGEFKRIGRLLGLARQLDVQISRLEEAREAPADCPGARGIGKVISLLKEKRTREQEKVYRKLIDFHIKEGLPGLDDWLKGLPAPGYKSAIRSYSAKKKATVFKYLDKLAGLSAYACKPENSGKLHRIRVAAKNLRYTLEILRPWYGKKFDKQINACRGIQDALGDLHELDLLGGVLSDYPGGKNSVSGRAAFILRRKYAALRNESYSKFIKIWDEASREHLWETLRREA